MRRLLLVPLVAGINLAATIRVPSQQPTIQAGLNAAFAGDTVLVAPGTYGERLTWPVRDGIRLVSEDGAEQTSIDGEALGRVILMNAMSYTAATEVSGFTIMRGMVSAYPGNGAGIWCTGSPVFSHNRIVNNRCNTMGFGGGVYAVGAPTFACNYVAWDTIWAPGGGGWRYGAGICCFGPGVLYQNVFMENASFDTSGGGFWYGGAVYLSGSGVVFGNLFIRNQAGTSNGGIGYGGALYLDTGTAYVANNTFTANRCSSAIVYGGAVYVNNPRTRLKNNVIVGNVCRASIGYGGGIAARADSVDTLRPEYCDILGNLPDDYYHCRAGTGTIAADPLFAAGPRGSSYLSQIAAGQPVNSPCVDAGDTLLMTSPLNLDSLLRAWTTRTDTVADQGALDIGYHYPAHSARPYHDVGCMRILAPGQITDSGITVTPACSVYNYGNQVENYQLRFRIGSSYEYTASVTGQNPGESRYFTFPAWTALQRGAVVISCSTELASDMWRPNDKKQINGVVRVRDVGCARIIAPTGELDSGSVVTPACSVFNWGALPESYTVRMKIGSAYNSTARVSSHGAGVPVYVTFPDYTADMIGTFAVTCSTELAADVYKGNDRQADSVHVRQSTGLSEGALPGISESFIVCEPNPARGMLLIRYSVIQPGSVSLRLYDVTGKLVRTLAEGPRPVGAAGCNLHASSLPGGIYLVRLETAEATLTRKLVVD